jgi:hypothetical protein
VPPVPSWVPPLRLRAVGCGEMAGVPVADLLPLTPDSDDLAVTRQQAKRLFDELLKSGDRAVLLLLT